MAAVPVVVKHQGKKYELELDPTSNGETFKFQLYSLTGVEPERQKILVKGGQLKDDTDLGSLKLKAGHSFMMMGTPAGDGNGLQRPKERTKFVEDMTEAEVAKSAGAQPAGLQNLGNTCYLNSTLQTLRIVPELQDELMKYKPTGEPSATSSLGSLGLSSSSLDLTAALRDLYKQMSETQEGFPPLVFLNALRTQFPQFAQKAKNGHGFAQQDAEEAWTEILAQLRLKLKQASSPAQKSVIEKYFALSSKTSIECDDPAAKEKGEEAISGEESALKLDCHIDSQINHLRDGILAGLKETLEKRSPTLERDALYTKTSRLSRLPKYLTVHFVRFFWKRDSQKKAKILRKVTFPPELDVVEFCTDDLKKKLVPVRDKIRDVRKEVEDVERAKKRQKRMRKVAEEEQSGSGIKEPLAKKKKAEADKEKTTEPTTEPEQVFKTDDEIDAERAAAILAAKKELLSLVDPELAADDGANTSGIYELRGVITHQGASADSGHYTSYVKKEGIEDPNTGKMGEEDGNWWWFNDDKVSEVSADKVETLSGGGETHSALILLYRAVPLPVVEEESTPSKVEDVSLTG